MRLSLSICRLVVVSTVLLGVAACQGYVPQFNTPRFDSTVFVPPDPTQFARRDTAFTAVTQADLVDASGNCAGAPAAEGEVLALQRNVALRMTECEVVRAQGPPGSVDISTNERGDRTVTMTYLTPERPIYRFTGGRLASIERGAEPPPEPARKKPAPRRSGGGRAT